MRSERNAQNLCSHLGLEQPRNNRPKDAINAVADQSHRAVLDGGLEDAITQTGRWDGQDARQLAGIHFSPIL